MKEGYAQPGQRVRCCSIIHSQPIGIIEQVWPADSMSEESARVRFSEVGTLNLLTETLYLVEGEEDTDDLSQSTRL